MRWHRLGLLLALTGCAGGPTCSLIGCVSQLTVRLPAGATAGRNLSAEEWEQYFPGQPYRPTFDHLPGRGGR